MLRTCTGAVGRDLRAGRGLAGIVVITDQSAGRRDPAAAHRPTVTRLAARARWWRSGRAAAADPVTPSAPPTVA